jgi:uncharacterized protein (DUF362 family)
MSRTPAAAAFTPSDEPNSPMGVAGGIHPGRVVWIRDPDATSWDGSTGYWWDDNNTEQDTVDLMISKAIRGLTGETSDAVAWDALFRYSNRTKGRGDIGYQAGEKIVIKINMNNNASGNMIDASPHMVRGLLRHLVYRAGVSQSVIIVYDAQRNIGGPVYNACYPEFPSVGYNSNIGWVSNAITYSAEVTDSAARRLPQCVLDAEYMINMSILKRHDGQAAVTLCAKNHFGTIGSPSALHTYVRCWERGMGAYDPLVDIMGHTDIGGKTILYIIDGLYGGDYYGATPTRWTSDPFNNDWPSSIFASQDPVAIDSVGLDFLRAEWTLRDNADNYLHEAAMANDPCSGTFYDPEGDGSQLSSLGVHEHWNSPGEKQYSRNLGTGNGIELWQGPVVSIVDFSGDGKVDFKDFSILAQYWRRAELSVDVAPPLFGDGVVDFKDVAFLVANWLTATTIPPLPGPASIPHPYDGERDVDPNDDLSWTAGADAISHDVYFGTTNPPPFIRNQTDTTYDPGKMEGGTGHYWRIDAVNEWGKTTGTVWRFTTRWEIPI